MDLHLDVAEMRLPIRKARGLVVTEAGELCEADLAMLSEVRGVRVAPLKRLSDRHHQLAKALAGGMGRMEAAYSCGYKPDSVSILCKDEAFMELLEHYRIIPEAAYADLHQRLAGMSIDAAAEITRRMEADADRGEGEDPLLSTGQLMNILTLGADRTGYGPATKSTQININANVAIRLEAARKRVAELRDITPPKLEGETHDDEK